MQTTHEEAHTWIHLSADGSLNGLQRKMLDSHLASCLECQQYAASISKMESILRPLLQRQWTRQPIPLPVGVILSKSHERAATSMVLATRIAAIGVMFMIFIFSTWQLALSRPSANPPIQPNVPLIPIPSTSTQLAATNTQTESCEQTVYDVQENDTLASIAIKFGVSRAELVRANQMTSETVHTGAKMIVPLCKATPTSGTLTKTFTPVLNTITSTPGG